MKKFNYTKYRDLKINNDILQLIIAINRYNGKHNLFAFQKPMLLKKNLKITRIQSIESSNKIEGIITTTKRLKELVERKSQPRNRNEEEIDGYRKVLDLVISSWKDINLEPNTILQFHRDLFFFVNKNYGGKWKNVNNYIQGIDKNGKNFVRFKPLDFYQTPTAMQDLCKNYLHEINNSISDPLILTFIFILDFLCIHPFNDGNGRMSRLLTSLLLYKHNFSVGKYISLEKLIDENKEGYYTSLQKSSNNWIDNNNNPMHFVKYMLQILLAAYKLFDERVVAIAINKKTKTTNIKELFNSNIGYLTFSKIKTLLPNVSDITISRTLRELQKNKYIKKIGKNKFAKYIKI